MTLTNRLSMVLQLIAVACAVIVTVKVVSGTPVLSPSVPASVTRTIDDWRPLAAIGHRIGPPDARVTIIELADFECPVCRTFTTKALKGVLHKYKDVALVFRHWPLRYHRFAYAAARAAECAGDQGRFAEYHDLLYSKQDSLGLKSFQSYAADAGVSDLPAFDRCTRVTDPVAAVTRDSITVHELGGTGTPTIIVNGALLGGAPDSTAFARLVERKYREAGAD